MKKLWLFVTLCMHTLFVVAQSQSFPVQVIPQAIPPAPVVFSDYADNTTINSPLRVQLILNDFTITNREVRLKAYFEGNGISFRSNDNVSGAASLFLEGGIPTVLTNVELAPYFRFENITGITPNVYGQPIPEGVYQFCFEVFDVLTGRRLSARSCVTTVIFKNEPPFLVSPLNTSNIQEKNPQNIVFQWTPRHINVSNVEYELSIVEIWDNYVDPQTAFLSSPPVFQTTTTATTYVYGPADPLFLPNKKYAWRIQAKAKQGTEEIGLFKNQGYSEIFSFSYATPCDQPISITYETKGAHQVNISWEDFTTEIPKFKVRYRKQGNNSEWFYSQTSANWITLWDLRAETTYEFQIRKLCAVSESDWTIVDTFTTGSEQDETALYNCGIPPDINLENQNPLPSIEKGESFRAGDFDIKILEVSGSEGRFTGEGYVTIPYLRSIKVGVKFTNILINTDKQLAEGMVITSYNIDAGNIVDVDEAIDTVSDVVEGVGELFEGDNDLDEIPLNFDIEIEDITIEDDRIVITNPETGDRFDYPLGDDTVITDASGDVYYVDEEGNITPGGQKDPGGVVNANNVNGVSGSGELESLTAKGLVVYFKDGKQFGFDQVPEAQKDKLTDYYQTIKDEAGKDYTLIHQAVKKGDSTTIIAEIKQQGNTYELKDIIFKTKQGEKLNTKIVGNNIEVTVKGHYSFENETIYALVPSKTEEKKQLTAGAFTLWHLTERTVDIILVPVNNASLRANEAKQITDIFNKGVAKLNIKVAEPFVFDKNRLGANGLDVGDSPWLTAYNEEQNSMMAAFKQDPKSNYNKNTYYIFVCNDITPSRNIAGFMPLQRQYGFVFDSTTTAPEEGKGDLTKTIAHEIGHGVFALQHPFTKLNTDQGQTPWLMDYSAGNDDNLLSHMDWAQIHNPDLKFYIFQDEGDGELAGEIWFTPDWKPIEIKGSSTIISTSKSAKVKGTLPGFKVDGIRYTALFDGAGSFSGYYENGKVSGKKYEISPINEQTIKDKVYLFVRGENGCNKAYEADYSYVIKNKTSIVYDDTNTNIKDSNKIKCVNCSEGQQFIEDYLSRVSSSSEKEAIQSIATLICAEGNEKIDYELLVSQIYKDNVDYIGDLFWLSKKAMYRRALELYWSPKNPDAFKNYLLGLQLISQNISKYHKKLGNKDISKEELYAGLFYINDEFLKSLELQEKKDLLKLVFDHNAWWIGESLYSSAESDRSLIRKLIKSIPDTDLTSFVMEVGTNSGDRDRLLYMGYELTIDQFKLFTIEERLKMLQIILNGPVLDNWSGNYSTEDLVLNIIDSVKSEEANEFLKGLVKDEYRIDSALGKDLLYKQLVDKLDNSFIGDDVNRLSVVTKLSNLAFISKGIPQGNNTTINDNNSYQSLLNTAECKASYYWNVKNERFLWVFNVVNDQSNLKFSFAEKQKKINLKQDCVKTETYTYREYSDEVCVRWKTDETFDPFELVALEIIDDITFTTGSGACENSNAIVCGKVALVPAMFIDYLIRSRDNTRIQNGVFNTLTVASFYFSGGSIIAARGAFSAATFTAYADLFVTMVNPYFNDDTLFVAHATSTIQTVFEVEDEEKAKELAKTLQKIWTVGTIPLTIDTASSIPNPDKHIKAVAAYKALVRRVGKEKAAKIIASDPKLAEKVAKGLEEAAKDIEKSSDASKTLSKETEDFINKIDNQLGATGDYAATLKNSVLDLLPQNSKLRSSINQLDATKDQSLIGKIFDLNPKNNNGVDLLADFNKIVTEVVDAKELDDLLLAWNILKKRSPKIASIPENSKILAKVVDRFTYNTKSGFDGLYKLFNEGSQIASKQKLINGLKEADKLFDKGSKLPVQFSSIKKGEVTVNIASANDAIKVVDRYGRGEEVARYVDGVLQKKKVIPEDGAKVVKKGDTPEDDILQKGDDVGFRKSNLTDKITTTDELKVYLNTIDETTNIAQLEKKGIKSLFRGTTRNRSDNTLFPGNPNSQAYGISTSTDPIKATIFSIEGATSNNAYKGILQIGIPDKLKSIKLSAPNYRVEKELEVILQTQANNFANLSSVEISVDNARKLIKEIYGIDLPTKISRSYSDELLETLPESSLDKAFEFYQKAIQYNLK